MLVAPETRRRKWNPAADTSNADSPKANRAFSYDALAPHEVGGLSGRRATRRTASAGCRLAPYGRRNVAPVAARSLTDQPSRIESDFVTDEAEAAREWTADLRRIELDHLAGLEQIAATYYKPDGPVTPQNIAAGFAAANGDALRFDPSRGWMEHQLGRWDRAGSVRTLLGTFIAGAFRDRPKVVEKVSRETSKILPEAEELMRIGRTTYGTAARICSGSRRIPGRGSRPGPSTFRAAKR